MGRLLKHREKDNKWRLWSTNSDAWLTGWMSEDRMKQYLALKYEVGYKVNVIELYMTFPFDYIDKNTSERIDKDSVLEESRLEAFHEWQCQAHKGDYLAEVDKKFKELTKDAA